MLVVTYLPFQTIVVFIKVHSPVDEAEADYDIQLIYQFPTLLPVTHKPSGPTSLQWPERAPPYFTPK